MSIIDVVGKPCPIPVIEAKKALRKASTGDNITLLVDNEVACRNLEKMAVGLGYPFAEEPSEGANRLVTITVSDSAEASLSDVGLVVAIGSNVMGSGDDELGKVLMKSYLYSLTELDTPPETLLFYNGGVKLTTEGANTLDDLNVLLEKGTVISSCGACLNFYGLTDKLAVGAITNMYAISTTMAQAKRLINL